MKRYLDTVRSSPACEGFKVMAPGDREWAVAAQREREGVELDPATIDPFRALGSAYSMDTPV